MLAAARLRLIQSPPENEGARSRLGPAEVRRGRRPALFHHSAKPLAAQSSGLASFRFFKQPHAPGGRPHIAAVGPLNANGCGRYGTLARGEIPMVRLCPSQRQSPLGGRRPHGKQPDAGPTARRTALPQFGGRLPANRHHRRRSTACGARSRTRSVSRADRPVRSSVGVSAFSCARRHRDGRPEHRAPSSADTDRLPRRLRASAGGGGGCPVPRRTAGRWASAVELMAAVQAASAVGGANRCREQRVYRDASGQECQPAGDGWLPPHLVSSSKLSR